MNNINIIKIVILLVLFPIVDYPYLFFSSNHFKNVVKKITKEDMVFDYKSAIGAYLFLVIGIYYFVIKDLNNNNLKEQLIKASILGLSIYGTFDFTNGAIFKDYDFKTMLMDTLWGGMVFPLVTIGFYKINKIIN